MSIQREEITLKQYTSGTTLLYFSTHLEAIQDGTLDLTPSILEFNNINDPVDLTTFDGISLWKRNDDNINVQLSSITSNYITGHSYSIDEIQLYDESRLNSIRNNFSQGISTALATGATTVTTQGTVVNQFAAIPNHTDFVFATHQEIDDLFVNIKLNRTFGTLDTLNVYNNLVNSFPTQEAETGVVFGRLVARQSILDENGNKISIPLRNVPIGIFNSSEEFPSSTSVDNDGDRLYLNLKETSNPDDYFNIESFSADTNEYLRSGSKFTLVPDQYKHITTTNENGEFIIYNVPVGNQIAVFEVDFFKQGLTKDEIALNFFPFPPDSDNILDTIPNFSFKQFPVSVVPSWGTIQTGYTELDIVVNYDLRKWATFYVPPMAFDGNKLGSVDLINFSPSLNVDIRDMSKEGFPKKNIPIVEIHKIYDKDDEHTLLWEREFAQLKKTAKFFDHGFRAFKVRANMYDPKGYRTDTDGVPRTTPTSQGVWLAGYEFKLYYNQPGSIFRTTGFQRGWGFSDPNWRGRDHFHLNRNEGSDSKNIEVEGQVFPPYDKPWSHKYPNDYKIPSKPIDRNFFRNGTGRLPGAAPYYLEQPEFKDGDLNGLLVSNTSILTAPVGGYGAQYSSSNLFWFPNRFSKEVTASLVYKYESGVAWNETYSNGYQPSNGSYPVQPGISKVLNGEKYQRVECGYGYWLKPEGWPPISAEPWGDTIYSPSTTPGIGLTANFEPGILGVGVDNGNIKVQVQNMYIDVYNIEDKDIALALDDKATFSEGALSLYRVIDPNDKIPIGPSVIPTSATFDFKNVFFQRGVKTAFRTKTGENNEINNQQEEWFSRYAGGSPHANFDYVANTFFIKITNNGNVSVKIPATSITLGPGQSDNFTATEIGLEGLSLTLPGNSNFDFGTSKYTKANYGIKFVGIQILKDDGTPYNNHSNSFDITVLNTNKVADSSPIVYHLISILNNVETSYKFDGSNSGVCKSPLEIDGGNNYQGNVKMDGMMFMHPDSKSTLVSIGFYDNPITVTCGLGSFYGSGSHKRALPIEAI